MKCAGAIIKGKMKRIRLVLLVLAVAFVMTACSGGKDSDSDKSGKKDFLLPESFSNRSCRVQQILYLEYGRKEHSSVIPQKAENPFSDR